ncbi:unnamed protein product, partial [Closterium sp. NIES-53]
MASQRHRAGDGRPESADEGEISVPGEGATASGGMGRAQGGDGAGEGNGRERAMGKGEGERRGKGRGAREERDGRDSGRGASWGLAGLETAGARESVVLAGAAAWVVTRVALRGVLPRGTVAAMAAVWGAAVGAEWRGWGTAFRVLQPRLGASSPGLHLAAITPSAALAALCALHRSSPLSTTPSPSPWLLLLLHAFLASALAAVAGTAATAGGAAATAGGAAATAGGTAATAGGTAATAGRRVVRRAAREHSGTSGGGTTEENGGGEEGSWRGRGGDRKRGGGGKEGSTWGGVGGAVVAFERLFFGAWLAAGAAAVLLLSTCYADVAWRMAA